MRQNEPQWSASATPLSTTPAWLKMCRAGELQIRFLTDAWAAGSEEARRAFEAMMEMGKIDVTTIEAARRG
jgi:predicted 3-demethylubiquinone-9 3-methyltransferase (glyoxalase superfamily)